MSGPVAPSLVGRRALVTGGASGIGAEVARRFRAAGAEVLVWDRDEAALARLAREVEGLRGAAVDLRDGESLDAAFAALVRDHAVPDILVNNVAGLTPVRFEDATDEQLAADIDLTLGVPMRLTRRLLPSLIARGGGVVLNVASVNGLGGYGNEAYSAAKAGLIGFTRAIAVEYGGRGIRCNAVAPGSVRTGAWDARVLADPDVLAEAAAWYPLGRVGEPDDVAAALLFLASDAASWITGVCLAVDGGLTAGNQALSRRITTDLASPADAP